MTLPTRDQLVARVAALRARLDGNPDEVTRLRVTRLLDAARADLHAATQTPLLRGHRPPYVGEGADGARRSAQIDREEADCLDRDDPRYERLLASAADWDRQAAELEPVHLAFRSTVRGQEGTVCTCGGEHDERDLAAAINDGAVRADDCTCLFSCAEDPASACSLSGTWHVHPSQFAWDGLGRCPEHPDAPGDL